ncbi:MAG: asparagine synthase (glutamine-hydrolyzing) [Bacteroidales bacterium]|nr:asparagine synthase (glutamine-hydrolyzing) [Candidatus Latescibacterota bacterium]
MCGIAGIFHFESRRKVDPVLLRRMTDLLTHRGPDDSGYFIEGRTGLGHRRLSIIDLKTGGQPMTTPDGTVTIAFNGEIYNFRELRKKLKASGHSFQTNSDTEVILASYRQWGTKCLEQFNGMFAIAIWDSSRNRLMLARDRLGIKPLYTAVVDNTLLFASEVKSILAHPKFKRQADPESISSYLGYRCVPGDRTLFKDIEKLSPGHLMVCENGYISREQYWDIPFKPGGRDQGEEHYIKKISALMKKSVKRRMISDVPIGAYLSGGLDSSIIVSLMAQMSNEPIKTYTVGFPEEDFNERGFARAVADMYGTDHKEIIIDDRDYTDMIPELIRYKDAPLAVANEVPLHIMSRELKKDITVVLSGEGADELFAGYGRIFRSPFDFERSRFLENDKTILPEYREQLLSKIRQIYGAGSFLDELDHFTRKYHWMSMLDKERLLSRELLDNIDNDSRVMKVFADQFKTAEGLSHYEKLLYVFQKIHLENLLMRVDMTTMATSVEARVPFVDHELIEYVFNIPFHHKIRWKSDVHRVMAAYMSSDEISEVFDTPKYILKKAFTGSLPEEVITRKKMGFPVPLNKWLGGRYMNFIKEILLDRRTYSRGIFNVPAIEKIIGSEKVEDHNTALKLWMLMNLEIWFREYIDKPEGGVVPAVETRLEHEAV